MHEHVVIPMVSQQMVGVLIGDDDFHKPPPSRVLDGAMVSSLISREWLIPHAILLIQCYLMICIFVLDISDTKLASWVRFSHIMSPLRYAREAVLVRLSSESITIRCFFRTTTDYLAHENWMSCVMHHLRRTRNVSCAPYLGVQIIY